ncbi:hypothetical protein [Leptospira bandrabouensis]|uniref:Uncharacterized protein n=1 Tax=Leptospira bandrabouensis TaxID=2484903 RepID=A0A6H3NSS6_9LEPT|nr:hypothetical protein [Leptospira bandrabouensis]TGN09420.1 hypothetical protein EHR07_01435 [Leptospira bandrabouensis]TGN12353.1 hypothetical protein EHR08_13300 [Leptospira bandrabouensis]
MKKTLTLITFLLLTFNCQSTVKTEISSYGLEEIRVNQTYDFVYREGYDFAPLTRVFEAKAGKHGWKRNRENPSVLIDLGLETSKGESLLGGYNHKLKVKILDKNQTVYYGEVALENKQEIYIDSIPFLVTSFWSNYPSRVFKLEKKVRKSEAETLEIQLGVYYNN